MLSDVSHGSCVTSVLVFTMPHPHICHRKPGSGPNPCLSSCLASERLLLELWYQGPALGKKCSLSPSSLISCDFSNFSSPLLPSPHVSPLWLVKMPFALWGPLESWSENLVTVRSDSEPGWHSLVSQQMQGARLPISSTFTHLCKIKYMIRFNKIIQELCMIYWRPQPIYLKLTVRMDRLLCSNHWTETGMYTKQVSLIKA